MCGGNVFMVFSHSLTKIIATDIFSVRNKGVSIEGVRSFFIK